jgi:hypothetical protein
LSLQSIDIPIIGDSNGVPQDDPQYTLNFYAEKVSDEVLTLKPTPGTTLKYQLDYSGGNRGLISVAGRLFGVRGPFFQEIVSGVGILLGTLGSSAGKVAIIANSPPNGAAQILIVDDTSGYVFDLVDSTFTTLTGLGGDNFLGGGSQAAYCAGRALVFKPGSQYFQMSDLYNFKVWTTTTAGAAFTLTTPIIAVVSNGDLAYFFSSGGFEVWSDQGLPTLPIGRILAGDKIGILAPNSALFCERHVYWVGRTSTGQGIVYRHSGGAEPERISNHSTERNIAAIADPTDGNAFTYTSFGHVFYIVSFTLGNRTFAWDKATNLWHDRAQREPLSNADNALPFVSVVIHNGMVLEADYRNGDIMEIDETNYTDNGNPISRERILPVTPKEGDFFTFYQSAELFGELAPPPPQQSITTPAPKNDFFDAGTVNPSSNGWTVDQYDSHDGVVSSGTAWEHYVADTNRHTTQYAYRTLPTLPVSIQMNAGISLNELSASDGLDSTATIGYSIITCTTDGTYADRRWKAGIFFKSHRDGGFYKTITVSVWFVRHEATVEYSNDVLIKTLADVDIPYSFSYTPVIRVDQGDANVLKFYVDSVLVYTTTTDAYNNLTKYVGIGFARTSYSGAHETDVGFGGDYFAYYPDSPPIVTLVPQYPTNIMMRISRDRGATWEPEQWQQVGGNATYMGRTRWVGLGSAYSISLHFKIVANMYVSWRGVRLRLQ